MTEKERVNKLREVEKDLFASQDVLVMSALKKVKDIGDTSMIVPLLTVYKENESKEVRNEISTMLSTIKVTGADLELGKALKNPEFKEIRGSIMNFMWNAGVNPIDHIDTIAQIAVEGSFMDAVESLTVIENMEGPFPEEELMEALVTVKEFMVANPDDEKIELIKSLHELLTSFEHYQ
jgi:hypothetical protein